MPEITSMIRDYLANKRGSQDQPPKNEETESKPQQGEQQHHQANRHAAAQPSVTPSKVALSEPRETKSGTKEWQQREQRNDSRSEYEWKKHKTEEDPLLTEDIQEKYPREESDVGFVRRAIQNIERDPRQNWRTAHFGKEE